MASGLVWLDICRKMVKRGMAHRDCAVCAALQGKPHDPAAVKAIITHR